jgi:peptidoglycan/LPS O-acetylase OafA/YrhL
MRRGFRLFPLYLFALIVSAALLPVQSAAWQALAPTPMNVARASLATTGIEQFATQFAWHLPLAQGLQPAPAPYTILGQAWSISLEWQFYLLAPLLYLGLTNRRFTPLAVAVAGALVLMAPALSNAFIGSNLALFLVGMTSYLALGNRRWTWAAAILGAFTLLDDGPWLAIPLAIWTLVLVAAATGSWPARLLASRFVCYLGEISYSTYLLHMIPLFGSIYLLTAWGIEGLALQVAVATLTVTGTLTASAASYRFIELPGIQVGAKLTKRNRRALVSQAS